MNRARKRPALRAALLSGLLPLLAVAAALTAARAQGLLSQGGDLPVTINADQGIEWLRDERKYVARGNATATRNNASIKADKLTAFYRDETGESGQEIFRVDADGNVRINADDQQALGDKAVYYVDKAVFVLVGKNLRLLSKQGTLTARDSLEYWEKRGLAVARGDAVVVQQDQRIRADVLTAHVADQETAPAKPAAAPKGANKRAKGKAAAPGVGKVPEDNGQIRQVDAFGNVHISLQNAIVRGDTGVYTPANGVATICGNVRITSGNNQLNGKCAEVNLITGIYRLTGRAKGLVQPEKKDR
jgi:lipopolysaccharide export system protein LptA